MKPVNRYLNGMYDTFIVLDGWRKTSKIFRRSESATAFCRCWLRWQMQYVVCNYGRIRFATPDALRSGGKSTLTHTHKRNLFRLKEHFVWDQTRKPVTYCCEQILTWSCCVYCCCVCVVSSLPWMIFNRFPSWFRTYSPTMLWVVNALTHLWMHNVYNTEN